MSKLEFSESVGNIQAFGFPGGGQTANKTMTGVPVSTAQVPKKGMYRVSSTGVVNVARDTVPGVPIATANDMPIGANQPETFGLEAGDTVSAVGAAGIILSLTLMP